MKDFQTPNLDSMYEEELEEMSDLYYNLNSYCYNKLRANWLRKNGKIKMALHYEKVLDKLYHELPEWARW